jgi:hypothetical protein
VKIQSPPISGYFLTSDRSILSAIVSDIFISEQRKGLKETERSWRTKWKKNQKGKENFIQEKGLFSQPNQSRLWEAQLFEKNDIVLEPKNWFWERNWEHLTSLRYIQKNLWSTTKKALMELIDHFISLKFSRIKRSRWAGRWDHYFASTGYFFFFFPCFFAESIPRIPGYPVKYQFTEMKWATLMRRGMLRFAFQSDWWRISISWKLWNLNIDGPMSLLWGKSDDFNIEAICFNSNSISRNGHPIQDMVAEHKGEINHLRNLCGSLIYSSKSKQKMSDFSFGWLSLEWFKLFSSSAGHFHFHMIAIG